MKKLKFLMLLMVTLSYLPLVAFCPCCDQEPPPCTCEIDDCMEPIEVDEDECQCDLKTLLYIKGGARWYPKASVTWPSIGLGWRCSRNKNGFDISVSTAHPTMNFAHFKHYYNVNLKALALYIPYPTRWSTTYWGAGIGMDHHKLYSLNNTSGTLEGLLGYEFPFARCTRGFLQFEVSQPVYGHGGFHWYRATALSLMMGVGY